MHRQSRFLTNIDRVVAVCLTDCCVGVVVVCLTDCCVGLFTLSTINRPTTATFFLRNPTIATGAGDSEFKSKSMLGP